VKIRGFRIEPGEVEAVLKQHPQVRDATVLVREDAPGDQRLVAYAVPVPGSNPTDGELRDYMRARLPEFMIPAATVRLDHLPLTPNGKIDRHALVALPLLREDSTTDRSATRLEHEITSVWQEVLACDHVPVTRSFFDLGGNSLLLARAHARLCTVLGRELRLLDMFRYPTIRALAEYLGDGSDEGHCERLGRHHASADRRQRLGRSRLRRART
jgi:hypothetical protein